MRGLPILQRRPLLLDCAPCRVSAALSTTDRAEGEAWAAALVARNLEGLMAKRASGKYDRRPAGVLTALSGEVPSGRLLVV